MTITVRHRGRYYEWRKSSNNWFTDKNNVVTSKSLKDQLSRRLKLANPKWIDAIVARVKDELPYGEDNQLVAKAVRYYLEQDLSRCHEFIGTAIIDG